MRDRRPRPADQRAEGLRRPARLDPPGRAPVAWAQTAMAPAVHLRAAVALDRPVPRSFRRRPHRRRGRGRRRSSGPTAPGKTSVLRACAGLLPVTSGEASWSSATTCATTPPPSAGRWACSATRPPLYDELTAVENVRFAVRAAGSPTDRRRRRPRAPRPRRPAAPHAPVGRLSAGQRRRVALAVLVARRPGAVAARRAPRRPRRRGAPGSSTSSSPRRSADGATVLLASHEPEVAVPMADRVVSMAGGRVVDERPGGRGRARRRRRPGPGRGARGEAAMWRDALLVAGKDLRIELRSRVALWQVLPVRGARRSCCSPSPSGPDPRRPAPGGARAVLAGRAVLAPCSPTQRSFAIESGEGTRDGLRLSGIDPAGVFLGQGRRRRPLQLVVLQVVLCGRDRAALRRPRARGLAGRRGVAARHRRPGVRRARSTGPCPPGCGCARRCSRCSCSRSWRRCCWPGRGRGSAALRPAPVADRRLVAADPRPLRRRLPGRRRRALRAPAGGRMTSDGSGREARAEMGPPGRGPRPRHRCAHRVARACG